MGSSKEKTKKKVEADVEFSTPIKFFFELSPPKLQSRVHSFSPTSRRGCARAGRPLRGSAPSRPSSGRGRPPSLPRVPLRLRRQRSVCFAVVAVSSGRRRNRLSSPSLALSLFAPISMPCRSPTRARRRIGAGEKTTGRRREPAPPARASAFRCSRPGTRAIFECVCHLNLRLSLGSHSLPSFDSFFATHSLNRRPKTDP